ncbi:MAG: hypothetical protein HC930_10430 [Hydrococcus sp. SU_1_0]|nr:hypothetical protein [Hydrococcus sp. SU_1_0]
MISQLIEQAQAFLIMQQDSVLFVARENDETFIKQIDLPSLIEAISQSNFQSDWYINPLLRLHHISKREGRTTIISSILPSTYLLKFESFCLGVPLPGAIIVHCQRQLWVYAYKGELDLDSTLYHYPLPNIDLNGKVCWGNVALSRDNPGSMWNAFVTSQFNQDYDNNKSQAHPYNIVSQLKEVAEGLSMAYPELDLVSTNLTLAALAQTNSQQSTNF